MARSTSEYPVGQARASIGSSANPTPFLAGNQAGAASRSVIRRMPRMRGRKMEDGFCHARRGTRRRSSPRARRWWCLGLKGGLQTQRFGRCVIGKYTSEGETKSRTIATSLVFGRRGARGAHGFPRLGWDGDSLSSIGDALGRATQAVGKREDIFLDWYPRRWPRPQFRRSP